MKLRNHPAICYQGLPTWPPAWSYVSGPTIDRPSGEVGVLTKVEPEIVGPQTRCFLHIEYKGGCYLGCLYIANRTAYEQVVSLFRSHLGQEVAAIGDLEISNLAAPAIPLPAIYRIRGKDPIDAPVAHGTNRRKD